MTAVSRRHFNLGLSSLAAASFMKGIAGAAARSAIKVSVFSDEITDDFGRACEIAAREFELGHVELRSMWKKNVTRLDEKELREVEAILGKNRLGVSSIAGPLFKVDWPGAPVSRFSPKREFSTDWTFEQQDEVLQREIDLARRFKTDRIRCFDFWRLDDPKPHRPAMYARLQGAAEKAGQSGLTLVMENEHECQSRSTPEAVETLKGVPSPHFKLNWDPGNAYFAGEAPYPTAYGLLPKGRIGHVHCKDAIRKPGGGPEWACMGKGEIDFVGQFRALARDGYRGFVVLETHWRGAAGAEESTRQSMAGMKVQLAQAGLA
jgi:sugar phosphate isomerase/epimerase